MLPIDGVIHLKKPVGCVRGYHSVTGEARIGALKSLFDVQRQGAFLKSISHDNERGQRSRIDVQVLQGSRRAQVLRGQPKDHEDRNEEDSGGNHHFEQAEGRRFLGNCWRKVHG